MASQENEPSKLEVEFSILEVDRLWPLFLHEIRTMSMDNQFTFDEAKKPENKYLNRYRDVNPYDHTRVVLSKDNFSYINASFINIEEARRKYILTQGPLPNTIIHFWLMVWEQNSKAIIMLNKIIEKNQNKCSQYWPTSTDENSVLLLPDVNLKVELLSEKDLSHYVVRNLRLTNVECNETREILHYHYTTWPDFGVPQSPLAFLKFLRDIRQTDAFRSDVGPPIVHCSAGIGRSGTFCLVDSCLVLMGQKGPDNVKVKDVLLKMRTCRMGLIQTPDQLRFSYIAVMQGLKVDWTAHDDDGLPEEEMALLKNGNMLVNSQHDEIQAQIRAIENSSSESDDEPPPLPPPRDESTLWFTSKPLPGPPSDFPTDSSDSDPLSSTDEETSVVTDRTSNEDIRPPRSEGNRKPPEFNVYDPRKRKQTETRDKSKRLREQVHEMKKKQIDAEKRKKQRSIFLNLTLGLSFIALSGAVTAYLWFRKS